MNIAMNTHTHSQTNQPPLSDSIYNAVKAHLRSNPGNRNLYQKLLRAIEPPLLEVIMEHTGYNQSKTASLLGLSRSTTRKKLEQHFGEKYFPQMSDLEFAEEEI